MATIKKKRRGARRHGVRCEIKKKKKKKRKTATKRSRGRAKKVQAVQTSATRNRQREFFMNFSVAAIATDRCLQHALREYVYEFGYWPYPKSKNLIRRWEPIEATVHITAYLTQDVPENLSQWTGTVVSPGDALVRGAKMYLRLFRENEKRGGDAALDPDVCKRSTERRRVAKRKGHKGPILVNRGFESLVWGHDLEDLVFEGLYLEKMSDGYHIHLDVGS